MTDQIRNDDNEQERTNKKGKGRKKKGKQPELTDEIPTDSLGIF